VAAWQCASLVSSIEVRISMPALFTIMSRRPNLSTAALEVGTLAHGGDWLPSLLTCRSSASVASGWTA
jgi:hypothetical protein